MALTKANKATPPESVEQSAAPDINLEDAIADQLLDDIDWQKVKIALLSKIKQKFFDWFVSGDRPINISAFPELSALPSSDEQEQTT